MSDYTETFTKGTGDTIEAADFETEFDAIATAVATKLDAASGTATSLTIGSGYSGSVITLGTEDTPSAVAESEYTGIPFWVKKITVSCHNVSLAAGQTVRVQVGHAGGYETTGYTGGSGYTDDTAGTAGAGKSTTGFSLGATSLDADTVNGQGTLVLVDSTNNIWSYSGTFFTDRADDRFFSCAGTIAMTGTLTKIKFITSSTFDAGTVNIAYEG